VSYRLVFALVVAIAAPGVAVAEPDARLVALGQRQFLRCASCHAIEAGQPTRIGPNLHGVVGRPAGSLPGYAYSPAMKAQHFVWTEAKLDAWLTRPAAVVPGTAMAFEGLPRPEDRAALIAYLSTRK
jgi:cytochrome c